MNTKRRLNCYVFCNLIVSFLTLNIIANPTSKVLVAKESNNTLNEIYEIEEQVIDVPDTIISSGEPVVVQKISNNNSNEQRNYNYIKPSYNSLTGNNLVNYAMQFLGLRYVSAGNSLATGTDCSGFTKLIYQEFGISLGRTVSSQVYSGSYVSRDDLQPGDLVFYSYGSVASHVAIYIGNGLIIHESTPRDGVKISSVNIMNYITARRLITSNVVSNNYVEEVKQEIVEEKNIETNKTDEVINNSINNEEIIEEKKENVETKIEVQEIVEEKKEKVKEEKDETKVVITEEKDKTKEVIKKEEKKNIKDIESSTENKEETEEK